MMKVKGVLMQAIAWEKKAALWMMTSVYFVALLMVVAGCGGTTEPPENSSKDTTDQTSNDPGDVTPVCRSVGFGDKGNVLRFQGGYHGLETLEFRDLQLAGMAVLRGDRLVTAATAYRDTERFILIEGFLPDGRLDETFGDRGRVLLQSRTGPLQAFEIVEGGSVASQADGKFIVTILGKAGPLFAIAVLRFNESGNLDRNFSIDPQSDGGIAYVYYPGYFTGAGMLGLDHEQRVIIAGASNGGQFVVHRLLSDGHTDFEFGESGRALVAVAGGAAAYALAIQPNGKILVGGRVVASVTIDGVPKSDHLMALVRVDSNGSPDAGFGDKGIATFNLLSPYGSEKIAAITQLQDGSIVATGESLLSDGWLHSVLVRYDHTGKIIRASGSSEIIEGPIYSQGLQLMGHFGDGFLVLSRYNSPNGQEIRVKKYSVDEVSQYLVSDAAFDTPVDFGLMSFLPGPEAQFPWYNFIPVEMMPTKDGEHFVVAAAIEAGYTKDGIETALSGIGFSKLELGSGALMDHEHLVCE